MSGCAAGCPLVRQRSDCNFVRFTNSQHRHHRLVLPLLLPRHLSQHGEGGAQISLILLLPHKRLPAHTPLLPHPLDVEVHAQAVHPQQLCGFQLIIGGAIRLRRNPEHILRPFKVPLVDQGGDAVAQVVGGRRRQHVGGDDLCLGARPQPAHVEALVHHQTVVQVAALRRVHARPLAVQLTVQACSIFRLRAHHFLHAAPQRDPRQQPSRLLVGLHEQAAVGVAQQVGGVHGPRPQPQQRLPAAV
mmetsp:Transcript_6372/g.18329  ORF Transcript_6372/g.18329 Transcript_6372/m.18329 type:complete len:245 (+) Transcript_6372:333-1067(+)